MMEELRSIITKKNNNNLIEIKLGKIENKIFNSHIDNNLFTNLLNIIKSKKYNRMDNKLYSTYYDKDNIYTIYDNGYEKHYKYMSNNKTKMKLNDMYDIESNIINCRRLSRDSFELKDKYDKTLLVYSVCFSYSTYIVEFNKIKDNNMNEYNEINIVINKNDADIDFF